MKKKLKKQIERQKLQQEEIEQGRLVEKEDENEDSTNNHDCKDFMLSDEKKDDEQCKDIVEQNGDEINTEQKNMNSEQMETNCDEDAFCEEVGSKLLQEQCVVSDDETRRKDIKESEEQSTATKGINNKVAIWLVQFQYWNLADSEIHSQEQHLPPVSILLNSSWLFVS